MPRASVQLPELEDLIAAADADDRVLITSDTVCGQLSIGRTTLWRITKEGVLPARRIGRAVRYHIDDVRRFAETKHVDTGRQASEVRREEETR
jgi:excisionase family DNA binding protein